MEQKSYMLIVLKSSIDPSYAPVGAAHASLAGYLKWEDDELTYHWANHIFNKHIKMATPEQFEKAKLPILVILSGMVTLLRPGERMNARYPILVTLLFSIELGIVTSPPAPV